eukprot:jgi/Astpho2/2661/fgenesh1_pg.00049_%23_24_t
MPLCWCQPLTLSLWQGGAPVDIHTLVAVVMGVLLSIGAVLMKVGTTCLVIQGCWMHHSFKYWQCTRFLCWKAAAWMCQVPAQLLTCGADRPVTAHRHCLGPTRFVTSKLHAASTAICTLALSKAPTLNNLTLHTACPGLQACCALGTQAPNTIFGLVDCRALTR